MIFVLEHFILIHPVYELKTFIGLCTLRIINMLVELNHDNKTEKGRELYINGKSSNAIKTRVKLSSSVAVFI